MITVKLNTIKTHQRQIAKAIILRNLQEQLECVYDMFPTPENYGKLVAAICEYELFCEEAIR